MTNYVPNIWISAAVTLPCATIVLALRLITRSITPARYGYDDCLAIIAYLGSVGYNTVALIWLTQYGLGKPIADGPKDLTVTQRLEKSWLLLWLGSETYSFAIAFSKFAILALYWRLFKYTGIRVPIQALSGFAVAWFILRLFVVNLQCIPIQALWDKSIKDRHCNIHEATFFFSTVLTHVIIDICILILPTIEVRKLPLPRGQKIAVMALFMFGTLVCITSVFVLVESWKFDSKTQELAMEMGIHIAWALAETNLSVISASLPMIRPVIRAILGRSCLSSHDEPVVQSDTYGSQNIKLATIPNYRNHDPSTSNSTRQIDLERDLPYLETHGISLSNDIPAVASNFGKKQLPCDDENGNEGIYVRGGVQGSAK